MPVAVPSEFLESADVDSDTGFDVETIDLARMHDRQRSADLVPQQAVETVYQAVQ